MEEDKDRENTKPLKHKFNIPKFHFKSVFTRLFVTYLGILIFSFIIVAAGLSRALETHFMKQKEKIMITQANQIARQFAVGYYKGYLDEPQIRFYMQMLDQYVNAVIWVVNPNGEIIVNSSDIYSQDIENTTIEKTKEELQKLLKSENIVEINRFNEVFSESTLTVGCPIIFEDYVMAGAIFIHAPIPEIKQSTEDVYKVFLLCLIASAIIAFILVYFTAKRITKPLKDINDAAKIISDGNFSKHIEIVSEDEIGQLSKSFNDMAEGLNKLEEYRSKFIANISHDLRSPITSIQGFLNAILDGTIPQEKQERYLKVVLDETNRLTKLTNDILELTKIENQEIELIKENFDINEMIRNILLSLETRIVEKNINMKVIFIQESSWVYADAQKIERVIYNLLDNAIKFTQEKQSITIQTTKSDEKINMLISDTGIGMKEEDLKHIFERFYKADISRGKDKKGTGLGLAIVREIIKAHKETITVKSEVGVGTTFIFSLTISKEIN